MKKRLSVLFVVLLMMLTSCYPYHDVNVNIEMTHEYVGDIEFEFSISSSSLSDPDTLESVEVKLLALLKESPKIVVKEGVTSKRTSSMLTINYKESFADKKGLEDILSRLSGSKVEISEKTKDNPLFNEVTIEGILDDPNDYISWIYDEISTKKLFDDNSSSISAYLDGEVSVDLAGVIYDAKDIRMATPETIESIHQNITINKNASVDAELVFTIEKSDSLDVDGIKTYFQAKLDELSSDTMKTSLSIEEKDDTAIMIIELIGTTKYDSMEFYETIFGIYGYIEFMPLYSEYEDENVYYIESLRNRGVEISKNSELKNYYHLTVDTDFELSDYDGITNNFVTVIHYGNYDLSVRGYDLFDEKDLYSFETYEKGALTINDGYIYESNYLHYNDSFMNMVWLILKIVGGLAALVVAFFAAKFVMKKQKEKKVSQSTVAVSSEPVSTEASTITNDQTTSTTIIQEDTAPSQQQTSPEQKVPSAFDTLRQGNFSELTALIKKMLLQWTTYVPVATLILTLLVVAFISNVIAAPSLESYLSMTGSGSSMGDIGFLEMIRLVLPTGVKYSVSIMGIAASVGVRVGLIGASLVVYIVGLKASTLLNDSLNLKYSADETFVRNLLSTAVYGILAIIFALIPRTLASESLYGTTYSVKVSGMFIFTIICVVLFGTLTSYICAYGKQYTQIVSEKVRTVFDYILKKIAIIIVISAVVLIVNAIHSQSLMPLVLIGNALVYVFTIGLGGSMAIAIPGYLGIVEVNYGMFVTSEFSFWILLLFIVMIFVMFYDVKKIYQAVNGKQPLQFSLFYAGIVVVVMFVLNYISGAVMTIPETGVISMGLHLASYPIVGVIVFVLVFVMTQVLIDHPMVDKVIQVIDEKQAAVFGRLKSKPSTRQPASQSEAIKPTPEENKEIKEATVKENSNADNQSDDSEKKEELE